MRLPTMDLRDKERARHSEVAMDRSEDSLVIRGKRCRASDPHLVYVVGEGVVKARACAMAGSADEGTAARSG